MNAQSLSYSLRLSVSVYIHGQLILPFMCPGSVFTKPFICISKTFICVVGHFSALHVQYRYILPIEYISARLVSLLRQELGYSNK